MNPENARQAPSFEKSTHTFLISDIHLTTAEPVHPRDPLWKKFKQRQFFIDDAFEVFLEKIQEKAGDEKIELILAGDIFDFDGVTQQPDHLKFRVSWLEKKRGLNTEHHKSRFKLRKILDDHPVFFRALSKFIKAGHRAVFIIGNHDLELHWPGVRQMILRVLKLNGAERERVRFNNWFYISNGDTLIEHGNQHDSHSNCQNPINPRIRGLSGERIRIPFGCIANRMMMNGMGYFNPHSDRSYLMTFPEYIKFFFGQLLTKEPLILVKWFWGAVLTLIFTLRDGFSLEVKDPLKVEDQVEEIAKNANATPKMVRLLKEVHAPPTIFDILGVARELWLDRTFFLIAIVAFGFEVLGLLNFVWSVSYWWLLLIFLACMPFFIFYFRSVKSKVIVDVKYYERAVVLGSKITGVKRVIFGHTHEFAHANFDGVEYLNSGTWSPVFSDVQCTKPLCPKTFIWIRPSDGNDHVEPGTRIASIFEWENNDMKLLC